MKKQWQYQFETFIAEKLLFRKRQRMATILAAVVVFCTTYALILPAITQEADPDAGKDVVLETQEEWEATLPETLGEDPLENLLSVAKSQLDYQESETAVITDAEGQARGATRYGIWYQNPYGKWDAMFVSFCLHYAGISEAYAPRGVSSDELMTAYHDAGLLTYPVPLEEGENPYVPREGDLIFLENTGDDRADQVGLITKVTLDEEGNPASLDVIEGDTPNQKVELLSYQLEEISILGYGSIDTAAMTEIETESQEGTAENTPATEDEQEIEMEQPMLFAASSRAGTNRLGSTISYTNNFSSSETYIVYMQSSDGTYYAMDHQGNAMEIFVADNGQVTTDAAAGSLDTLKWKISGGNGEWLMLNVSDNRRIYPSSYGTAVTHTSSGNGDTPAKLEEAGSNDRGERGVKIRSYYGFNYARLADNNRNFESIENAADNNVFYFAKAFNAGKTCSVWLDGSNGGLMSLGGALNERRAVASGDTFVLPTAWDSPPKYDYTLRGWYDVKNAKYYAPGTEITVTEDLVFYADWRAKNYDIGVYNADASDTVSTNDFISTKVFDYGVLFNVMSSNATTVNISDTGHSETWTLVSNGTVGYKNNATLNYIFRDWDGNGRISYPASTNNRNTSQSNVTGGLYYKELEEILFATDNGYDPETGTGIIGKEYLGTGDHLFQLMDDPNSEHYGYYYYDSSLHAASYNQKEERFYVYDYLERTSDSANSSGDGVTKYSDFVPLNSPYVNTNGKTAVTYKYDGVNGEYAGRDHYTYDAKYNSNGSATSHIASNFWFGMRTDVEFYLPETPGSKDADGNYGNQDVYGKDMHFQFSGDDDVWVLVDGKLVLDIGGIHGVQSGDINFATGIVTAGGQTSALSGIESGEHVLTILYLERGSSQSNCAIYFNLAPRFGLNIQKEDVLTQELLNGAQFTFYKDEACTVPAELWTSKASYNQGDTAISTVTVEDGKASVWGFGAGNTYYIKETKPPDADEYSRPNGIICLSLDKRGTASYSVKIIDESDGSVSKGFTVHGFRIDEETQQAYIVATNAPEWVEETTSIEVMKKWADGASHEGESVTVYLTVTDQDGTVRRLREIQLSEENDWKYVWTNMPKYAEDQVTEIQYGIEEGYTEGYYGTIRRLESLDLKETSWQSATSLENGKTYLLRTSNGYLSTTTSTTNKFCWVNEDTAKSSPLAIWTVSSATDGIKLTNGAGQCVTYNHSSWNGNNRYFYPTAGSSNNQTIVATAVSGGIRLNYKSGNSRYYFTGLNSDSRGAVSTSANSALVFQPMVLAETSSTVNVDHFVYEVTNTPLEDETSLKVFKAWDLGATEETEAIYEQARVTMKLFANGKDTGRTVTLSLKNDWQDSFRGLPYTDADGNIIEYTVEESWDTQDWIPSYGEVKIIPGDPDTYEVTVINDYRWGFVHELPATGGTGTQLYTIGGLLMILFAGFGLLYRYLCFQRGRRFSK